MIPEPARSEILARLDAVVRRTHGKPASEPIPEADLDAARRLLDETKPETPADA